VAAPLVRNEVVWLDGPVGPLELPAGPQRLRLLEHLLLDTRCPYRPVGSSSAIVVDDRLPGPVADGARRGEAPLDALLERDGGYWAAETRAVEKVGHGDLPTVRLTRLLYLLGTPVAAVVEEIRLPELCAATEDAGPTRRSA